MPKFNFEDTYVFSYTVEADNEDEAFKKASSVVYGSPSDLEFLGMEYHGTDDPEGPQ